MEGRWHLPTNIYKISIALNSFRMNRWSYTPRDMMFNQKFDNLRLAGIKSGTKSDEFKTLEINYTDLHQRIQYHNQKIHENNSRSIEKVKKKINIGDKVHYKCAGKKSTEVKRATVIGIEGCQIKIKNDLNSVMVRHAEDILS